jgi:pregnancy-associated plasma protein-A/type IX secretion system substrate protein/cleaved adhesin domain-containing protein
MNMILRKIYLLSFSLILLNIGFGQPTSCGYDEVQQQLMQQSPDYQTEVAEYLHQILPTLTQVNNSRTVQAVITIPVVVHVIHSGQSVGNGANLSVDRILSQIDILNEDYRRNNADAGETPSVYDDIAADTEIEFCMAITDPSGSFTSGITRHVYSNVADIDYIENTIKPATTWDPDRYLNIWTIAIPESSVIGYSYLPTFTMVGSNKDGVVIDYTNFGLISSGNQGRTCVHEVGHYLGLQHTWGQSDSNGDPIGCSSDDGIADTPNCSGPHYGCPNFGLSSCSNIDMTMNFMEYVDDDCMNLFTAGQKTVMQNILNGIRFSLADNAITACNEAEEACKDLSEESIMMGFESNQNFNGWEIENANNDNRTWLITQISNNFWGPNNGEGLAVYLWNVNGTTAADDYLFTPCFEVKNNHTYKVSFSYACAKDADNNVYNEAFEVGFSELQNSSDFSVLNTDWVFQNVNNPYPDYNTNSITFEASATTFTSIGFHAISDADRYALQIDDFKIEDLGLGASIIDQVAISTIQAKPNPTEGTTTLSIEFENTQKEVVIIVYDVLGRAIEQKTMKNVLKESFPIDLSSYEDGLYFATVKSDQILRTEKILLSK